MLYFLFKISIVNFAPSLFYSVFRYIFFNYFNNLKLRKWHQVINITWFYIRAQRRK
jgi:hypothetical protein